MQLTISNVVNNAVGPWIRVRASLPTQDERIGALYLAAFQPYTPNEFPNNHRWQNIPDQDITYPSTNDNSNIY